MWHQALTIYIHVHQSDGIDHGLVQQAFEAARAEIASPDSILAAIALLERWVASLRMEALL